MLSRGPTEPRLQFTLGVLGGTLAWQCKVPRSCFTCFHLLEHTLGQVGRSSGAERSSCLSHNLVSFKFSCNNTCWLNDVKLGFSNVIGSLPCSEGQGHKRSIIERWKGTRDSGVTAAWMKRRDKLKKLFIWEGQCDSISSRTDLWIWWKLKAGHPWLSFPNLNTLKSHSQRKKKGEKTQHCAFSDFQGPAENWRISNFPKDCFIQLFSIFWKTS